MPDLVEHALQLVPGLANAVAVIAVHHKDQTLCVLEVVPPQGADLQVCTTQRVRMGGGTPTAALPCLNSHPPLLRPHLVLASHIPHCEANVLVLHGLHVEACRGREEGSAAAARPRAQHSRTGQQLPWEPCAYRWLGWSSQSLPASACTGWLFYPQHPVQPAPGTETSADCPQPIINSSTRPGRTIRILISFLATSLESSLEMVSPMFAAATKGYREGHRDKR